MPILPTAPILASAFCARVRAELADNLPKINRRNAAYPADVCATHDFCDANMLMFEAWQSVAPDADADSAPALRLWNEAWAIAKAAQFTL